MDGVVDPDQVVAVEPGGDAVVGRIGSRLWVTADQVLSSLTNFVLTIVVARVASPSEFGAVALVLGVFLSATLLVRSTTSEPLLVLYSGDRRRDDPAAAAACLGTSVALGALIGAGMAVAGLLAHGEIATVLLLFAAFVPGLQLQDGARYVLISAGRPRAAFVNDLTFLLLQCAAATALLASGHGGVAGLTLTWLVAGNVCAGLLLVAAGVRARPDRAWRWLSDHRGFCARYLAEATAGQGSLQAVIFALSGVAGLSAAGAVRAAETVYKPTAVLSAGARTALIPELSRLRDDGRRVRRGAARAALTLVALNVVLGAPVLLLGDGAGRALLGDSWAAAQPLLVWVLLAQLASVTALAGTVGLRGMADARRSFIAASSGLGATAVLGVAGAALDDARGTDIGLFIGSLVQALVTWWCLMRSTAGRVATHRDVADLPDVIPG